MRMLRFTLKGKNAFFKKPDVNTYVYFTYSHIHKVALLGMFGAIMGYKGYAQMDKKRKGKELTDSVPEFYERLKELKISIIPNNKNAYISKKIQTFNNSVGYASKEQGGNLIVKEQWLDYPSWDICLLLNSAEAENLAKRIVDSECVYIPYLGKNDHLADIYNPQIVELCECIENSLKMQCLFPVEMGCIEETDIDDFEEPLYLYKEKLPIELDYFTNHYILKTFIGTNEWISGVKEKVYQDKGQRFVFY